MSVFQVIVDSSNHSLNYSGIDNNIEFSSQFINVIIMTCETLFFYIPNIWIVFAIVLWEGLLGGGAYVNTFYKMSKEVSSKRSFKNYVHIIDLVIPKTNLLF